MLATCTPGPESIEDQARPDRGDSQTLSGVWRPVLGRTAGGGGQTLASVSTPVNVRRVVGLCGAAKPVGRLHKAKAAQPGAVQNWRGC
jgi:hypothetical protein